MFSGILCILLTVFLGSVMYDTNYWLYINKYLRNNMMSYMHSLIQTLLTIPALIIIHPDVFFSSHKIAEFKPTNSSWILSVCSHWIFIWYTVLEFWFTELSDIYIFHHTFNSVVIFVSLIKGFSFFSLCGLATEFSTFLMHLVKIHEYKDNFLNTSFVFVFVVMRILVPVSLLWTAIAYRLYIVSLCLMCNLFLNSFWLCKIVNKTRQIYGVNKCLQ